LIKAAVSREREFLADAAAVEFTRNPLGLAGALKKIGGLTQGSRIHNHHAEEASHLFFAHGLRASWLGALSTHPPLHERIRRLDPTWQGEFALTETARMSETGEEFAGANVAGLAPSAGVTSPAEDTARSAAGLASVMASVGSPTAEHLDYAGRLLERIPADLVAACHDTGGALAMVFALTLADDDTLAPQDEVWVGIRSYGGAALEERVTSLLDGVRAQGPDARLPLLDLVLPALQRLSPDEASRFLKTVEDTVIADGRVRLFEYAMVHALRRRLGGPAPEDRRGPRVGSFGPLSREAGILLSALAWTGSGWESAPAARAFAAGLRILPSDVGSLDLLDQTTISLEAVDGALERFEHATPAVKKRMLEACAETAAHDRTVSRVEAEMLRAVAEALDCPIPPILR
jgi:hypothetical protein